VSVSVVTPTEQSDDTAAVKASYLSAFRELHSSGKVRCRRKRLIYISWVETVKLLRVHNFQYKTIKLKTEKLAEIHANFARKLEGKRPLWKSNYTWVVTIKCKGKVDQVLN
jgi:hypothetical protein